MQNILNPTPLSNSSELGAPDRITGIYSLDSTRPCIMRMADTPRINVNGESIALTLPSANTAGRVTAGTLSVVPNGGPPVHTHVNDEEIFLFQSGAFELFLNGEVVEARAGDVAYLARGEAHRFRGLESGEPNVFNILIAPGGFEHFYSQWAALFENGMPSPQDAAQLCEAHSISLPASDAEAPVAAYPQSKLIRAGQTPLHVLGNDVTMLLTSDDTEGRYSLARVEGPRDSGPPLHIHENEDELFMIEAGQVEFTLGEETVLAGAGDVVWGPRGFAHTFRIASETARMSVFMTPGGFEEFFYECALTELAGEASPAKVIAIGQRCGLTFVPPTR